MMSSRLKQFVPYENEERTSDSKLKVLIAENVAENTRLILESLADIKECNITNCDTEQDLLEITGKIGPDLLLIHFDLIQNHCLQILNDLRHKNPELYVIVYITAAMEETRNTVLMAGATECLIVGPENLHVLAGAAIKAVIRISERECPDGSVEPVVEEMPEIVFWLDLEGRCTYVNSAVSHLLGYEEGEFTGCEFSDFISNKIHRENFGNFLRESSEKVSFQELLTLQTALGIEEDFQVDVTLMEGEVLCGTAKKIGLGISPQDWKNEQNSEIQAAVQLEHEQASETLPDSKEVLPTHLGPYSVTSVLGEGAMGRVYKGFDEHLERYVAIKMINHALAEDTEHLERFKREARLLASISHPNIALIFYFDLWNNLPFFCMEYLPEGSVDQLLKQKRVLDPQTAILFVQQVALGLKKAQEKGVVHLDIKPSNLMVAEKNRIKIVDFGLAATHRELEENSDTIIGTPAYLAPEQLNGGIIDHRCDIYSLGITFFEMLYGCLPYPGKNVKEIFAKKLTQDIPGPELLSAEVPAFLYDLIRRMVERDPNQRIQDYSDLIDNLEEAKRSLSSTPVVTPSAKGQTIRSSGNLYDTSFAEILGDIWKERFTGRLTLHWLDLSKVIHFKEGTITAVLSNQEGERFIDLLISERRLKPDAAWKIQTARSDLFTKYSLAMELVGQENRETLNVEFDSLAWKIMESLFSWGAGEYQTEEGTYPEQPGIRINMSDAIVRGVRHHTDFVAISRKLLNGKIKIMMSSECTNRLRQVRLTASERFLLLKTEGGITFSELHTVSNLPREMFCRLIYLFLSLGLVQIQKCEQTVEMNSEPMIQKKNVTPLPTRSERLEPEKFELKITRAATGQPHVANLVDQYCRQAAEDYGNGLYWSAVQHCKKALELKEDFRIYHLMGKALAKHQGFKYDAMKALKTALAMSSSNAVIQKDIADLYLASDNIALAEAHYKKILTTHPRDKHCIQKLNDIAHRNDFSKVVGKTLGKFFGSRKHHANP